MTKRQMIGLAILLSPLAVVVGFMSIDPQTRPIGLGLVLVFIVFAIAQLGCWLIFNEPKDKS